MRLTNEELKQKGFIRFNYTNAYVRDDMIVSYGLPVALKVAGKWTSVEGLHNYSPTTSKNVTQITGTSTADRKKEWVLVTPEEFDGLKNNLI